MTTTTITPHEAITQVMATFGHASRRVRISGSTWVTSPSADSRNRQMDSGTAGIVFT